MIKPLSIAVVFVFGVSGTGAYAKDSTGKTRASSHAAHSGAKLTRSKESRSRVNVGRSDEPIIDRCRDLRGSALALCLHEKRGDPYAAQWRSIVAGGARDATGGTSATGAAGTVTPAQPNETQPGLSNNPNAAGR